MYHVNGFVNIGALQNNTWGTVSPIGEISELSRTFCKEKGIFSKDDAPGIELISLHVRKNDGTLAPLPDALADRLIDMMKWIYDEATTGDLGSSSVAIAQHITQEYGSVIDTLTVGAPSSNGNIVLPSSIGFSFLDILTNNSVKVWFSDTHIQNEYPEYEFEIITPVNSLDVLFQDKATIENALAAFTRAMLTAKINEIQGQYLFTHIFTDTYKDIISAGANGFLLTDWTIIGYGPQTTNPDLRKQALIEYVLDNSSYDEEDWTERFPELFISTECVIVPHWDINSIPNAELSSSLYSSIFLPNMGLDYLDALGLTYGSAHIETTYRMVPSTYKGLGFSTVLNPRNVDGEIVFNAKFSDYLPISPQQSDFGHMSQKTQRFVNLLNNMLPIAETMTPISGVPTGMARIKRDEWTYLGASIDGVLYLVVPRYMIVT